MRKGTSPVGYLGCHALYIILENIIRNSTKHGFRHALGQKLKLAFSINTNSQYENLIEVIVHDNFGYAHAKHLTANIFNDNLVERINTILWQPLLGKDGSLRKDAWGIIEMKICASFLRGIYPENIEDVEPPILEAMNIEDNLAFRFYLIKGQR